MPGVNKDHHTFQRWLLAFLFSLPIFLLAYYEIIKMLIKDFRSHLVVVSVFLGMISMSILYYTQVRFRVITLEPLYIIYASSFIIELYQRFLQSICLHYSNMYYVNGPLEKSVELHHSSDFEPVQWLTRFRISTTSRIRRCVGPLRSRSRLRNESADRPMAAASSLFVTWSVWAKAFESTRSFWMTRSYRGTGGAISIGLVMTPLISDVL